MNRSEICRRYYLRHRKKCLEYTHRKYVENREKRIKQSKEWKIRQGIKYILEQRYYAINRYYKLKLEDGLLFKQKKKISCKKYYVRNKDKIKQKVNNWINNNRQKFNAIVNKHRSKLRQVIHCFTTEEWINKVKLTNGFCPKCNKFIGIDKLTMDHIYPLSKAEEGRVYTIDDVQPLCKSCNCSKYNTI